MDKPQKHTVNKVGHKRPPITGFHLHEIPRKDRSVDTGSISVFAQG